MYNFLAILQGHIHIIYHDMACMDNSYFLCDRSLNNQNLIYLKFEDMEAQKL